MEHFASAQAFSHWKNQMHKARQAYRAKRAQYVRTHCRLIVGPEQVAFLDTGEKKLTVIGRDGAVVTEQVQDYAISNLHQLTLDTQGRVTARGDSEAGQNQVSGFTGIAHVLAGPRCSYLVDQAGQVQARGACAIQEQIHTWNEIQTLACGSRHLVGLGKDGSVVQADDSVAGRSTEETKAWPPVCAIAAAGNYTLGLHSDGTVSYAGPVPDPRQEARQWQNICAIAADYNYALGLTKQGQVCMAGKCVPYLDAGRSQAAQWTNVLCIAAGYGVIAGVNGDGQLLLAGSLLGDTQIQKAFSQCNPAGL